MRRNAMLGLTALLGLGLGGCDMLLDALSLDALNLLGVMPKAGFSRADRDDFGKVVFAVAAEDKTGFSLAPPLSLLEFRNHEGELLQVVEETEVPGADAGSFVLLVDGSASMLDTDPDRFRVQAASMVASRIEACSEHWEQALMEFNTEHPGGQLDNGRVLASLGSSGKDIAEAAQGLDAEGMTPLFDATHEVLRRLDDHSRDHEQSLLSAELEGPGVANYGRALVVISDGADTSSRRSLAKVVETANEAGISVHAIGVGPASDALSEVWREDDAIEALRQLALQTGGTYGYVSTLDELPDQADAIANAVCGGYTQVTVEFDEPAEEGGRMHGFVNLVGTPIGLPYTFTAP